MYAQSLVGSVAVIRNDDLRNEVNVTTICRILAFDAMQPESAIHAVVDGVD